MNRIAMTEINDLLNQFQGEGLMVSCYADLTIDKGFASRWQGPFKAKSHEIKQMLGDGQRAWHECERNLEAVEKALQSPDVQQAKSVAVFSALQRDFFQAFPLDEPVANELVVHPAPYLVPLLRLMLSQREYLVVHTDTHRGRLYAAAPGGVRLLEEIDEEVPPKQHSSGQRLGKQQATIARHREDHILHYQKELVERMQKLWEEHPFQGIFIMGEHEVIEQVCERLPSRLADQVLEETSCEWTNSPDEFREKIRGLVEETVQVQERGFIEQFRDRLHENYGIATGAEDVIAALQEGKIGARGYGYLVLGPDRREAVARCTACRSLFANMPKTCPHCQAPCIDANLWEELLLFALRHQIAVHFAKDDDDLARCEGLAAVLPQPEPRKERVTVTMGNG